MRRKSRNRIKSPFFGRGPLIEALEPRNAVSTLAIASTAINPGQYEGAPKPAGSLANVGQGISLSPSDGRPASPSQPSIPGKVRVAIPQAIGRTAPSADLTMGKKAATQANPARLVAVDANKITITPAANNPRGGNRAGGGAAQSRGGVASGDGRIGVHQSPIRSDGSPPAAGIPSGSPSAVSAVTAPQDDQSTATTTTIRPLGMSGQKASLPGGVASAGGQTNFYSGGGNERIPYLDYGTFADTGQTDNADPEHPGQYLEDTTVTDVIGGSASVTGLDGVYSSFDVTVSGGAVVGPPDYGSNYGMIAASQYSGSSFPFKTTNPGASWYWEQFSGMRKVTVDVTYPNGDYGSASFEVNVQPVTGTLTITPAPGTTGPRLVNKDDGSKAFVASDSFTGTASAPYVSGGGSIGIIQTMDPMHFYTTFHRNNISGTQYDLVLLDEDGNPSSPRPIIDDEGGTFYASNSAGSVGIGKIDDLGNTETPISTRDSPGVKTLDQTAALQPGDGYDYDAKFTDVLMYKPDGGIWVPIAKNGWRVTFKLTKRQDGTYNVDKAPDATPDGSSASSVYPRWIESVAYLRSTPYRGVYSEPN